MVNSDLRSPQSRQNPPGLRLCLVAGRLDGAPGVSALGDAVDAFFVKLDDSHDPAARERALALLREFSSERADDSPLIYVQTARLESAALERDLAEIIPCAPAGILLEDARSGANVQQLSAKLSVAEAFAGVEEGRTKILALLQSPAAVLTPGRFSGASARLAGLVYDEESLRAQLPSRAAFPGEPFSASTLAVAQALVVLAAGAAGVAAIASLSPEIRDESAAERRCHEFFAQGFSGVAAGPDQIGAARLAARRIGRPPDGDRQKAIF